MPNLDDPANLVAWRRVEDAKHRLVYTLMRLGLPLPDRRQSPQDGLMFDILADPPDNDAPRVMTGHDNGLVTLALAEADDAERERRRTLMREPYRTLLGHFRHEVGHWYWDRLVRDRGLLAETRTVFGDDTEDYAAALQRHYDNGPPPDWQQTHVSAYATTHAWEDFAETWSHYLHIVDSLETAQAFGIEVKPDVAPELGFHRPATVDPWAPGPFEHLVEAWLPLTFAMNSMNRSMGLPDLYPFVLSAPVIAKLAFIHALVHRDQTAAKRAA